MSVRAKFTVQSITKYQYGGVRVTLSPQYDESIPEDQRFSKATPSGEFWMVIDNPAASDQFGLGKVFYVDLTAIGPERF